MDQDRAAEVAHFLDKVPSELLFITDFAFHSISIIMVRLNQKDALLRFVQDAFLDGGISLVHLEPRDFGNLVRVIENYKLDFDDAYHYTIAEKNNLTLVSFDSDFDGTENGRKTPREIVKNGIT